MKILALIPARKGSVRLPHKNTLEINGKTLVDIAIEQAKKTIMIDKIVVLSADNEIRKTTSEYADIGFELEPEELSKGNTPAMDYIKYIESKYDYDFLVLLQPTSPIRDSKDIDKCIKMLQADDMIDSVVTVSRQLNHVFLPNGNIYVMRRGKSLYNDNMVCFVQDEKKSVDIDTMFDFKVAEMFLEERITCAQILGD